MTADMQAEDGLIPMRVTITARYHADPDAGVYDPADPAAIAREDLELAVGAADRWGTVDLAALVDALANCANSGGLDDVAVTITPTSPPPTGSDSAPACAWLSAGATATLLRILLAIAGGRRDRQDLSHAATMATGKDIQALAVEALALLAVSTTDSPTVSRQP
jgi:hypothetical protein